MSWNDRVGFESLVGKTLVEIRGDKGDDELYFVAESGEQYKMYHSQSCCESVWLEDVDGDLQDLIGETIVMADESSRDGSYDEDCSESRTWTFYRIGTGRHTVVLRWCGESNGYYSEGVDFELVK